MYPPAHDHNTILLLWAPATRYIQLLSPFSGSFSNHAQPKVCIMFFLLLFCEYIPNVANCVPYSCLKNVVSQESV